MISSSSIQGGSSSLSSTTKQSGSTDENQLTKWQAMTFYNSQITSLIESVESTDIEKQYYGIIGLRKVLCDENQPPINQVLDSGIVPTLIEIMGTSTELKIQCEAAWSLTNLCSSTSEQTKRVIDSGVISGFLTALRCANPELIEQSVWGLGNIAGGSTEFRDLVIKEGGIDAIVNVLENASTLSLKRNGAWTLSNCCRGEPQPPFHLVSRAVPIFCKFLKNENDSDVLNTSAWGLLWNSEGNEEIETIINNGVIPVIVKLLSSPDTSILTACLRLVGSLVSGTDEQRSVIFKEKDLFPALLRLSTHATKLIRKEAFWTISNITAGPPDQFEGIMGNPTFVKTIIYAVKGDDGDVRKEAIYALANSALDGTPAQIIRLLDNGVFRCLIEVLHEIPDAKMLDAVLEGIESCLAKGKQFNLVNESGVNRFVIELEEHGGLDKIEILQKHESNEVYERTFRILTNYFETDEQ